MKVIELCELLVMMAALSITITAQSPESTKEWKFRVLLDDRDIGHHHFTLTDTGSEQRLESEALFDARIFLLLHFRYQHSNTEVWRDDCLAEITSQTTTNGKAISLRGIRDADAFVVTTNDQQQRLPACVRSFAYWDKQLLEEGRLMNPQTGRYHDINIEAMDSEPLTVRGKQLSARRYRLSGEKVELDVWYSASGEWLQLESKVRGGRTLRYQLT
jgi:hypothetical protein